MEEAFKTTLTKIFGQEDWPKTILAVSGGVDSIVLAHLYHKSNQPFIIAHCNFQLRGEESQKDERFVISLGQDLGVKVTTRKFDTAEYAKLNKCSIQMAARNLRYAWFKELVKTEDAKIATAHHANDVAETIIFNLTKGTGLAGLHGISEDSDNVIRPLLWANKEDILEYASENNLVWREDQSNESEKYMRNIIRKKVIPELERINPSFLESTSRTVSRIKEVETFFKYSVDSRDLLEEQEDAIYINKTKLRELPGRAAVLNTLISEYGFNYDQVLRIESSWGSTGAIFFSDYWSLNIDREYLIISKKEGTLIDLQVDKEQTRIEAGSTLLKSEVISAVDFVISDDRKIAFLDLEKLSFPLELRNWRHGDTFTPLGMKGRKKVSDFLIDAKISVTDKGHQLVLLSDQEIIWLVGLRIDDQVKITDSTKDVYQIQLVK